VAEFTQTLTFVAQDQAEYDDMVAWAVGAGANALVNYEQTWDADAKTLTLTTSGTRSTNWLNG